MTSLDNIICDAGDNEQNMHTFTDIAAVVVNQIGEEGGIIIFGADMYEYNHTFVREFAYNELEYVDKYQLVTLGQHGKPINELDVKKYLEKLQIAMHGSFAINEEK